MKRRETLEEKYQHILACTDFWFYLLVWSELGRRPAWIGWAGE